MGKPVSEATPQKANEMTQSTVVLQSPTQNVRTHKGWAGEGAGSVGSQQPKAIPIFYKCMSTLSLHVSQVTPGCNSITVRLSNDRHVLLTQPHYGM